MNSVKNLTDTLSVVLSERDIMPEYGLNKEYFVDREQILIQNENQTRHRISIEFIDSQKIQAYINNISFPTTLEELMWYVTEHGMHNVEDVLYDDIITWTVPQWTKIGDIVFFMHAKTAISTITRLRTQLKSEKDLWSSEEYDILMEWIDRAISLHKKYGGKIFVVGQVCGAPENMDFDDGYASVHWGSKIYADIIVDVLDVPIDISEFNDFIYVSRCGAITGVFGKEYTELRRVIKSKNRIPDYLEQSESSPLPLAKVKPSNWMQLSLEYRRCFMFESQFRSYYVDYLLKELGDQKTIYKECRCVKPGISPSFIDNVILIGKKYLPVEIKISVPAQSNIKNQVQKYCSDDYIVLDNKKNRIVYPEKIYNHNVLVIDTVNVYWYSELTDELTLVFDLDDLKVPDDIVELRNIILERLKEC